MSITYKCVMAREATYSDSIAVKLGDRLRLTGKTDCWEGHLWLWAVADDGREGWVPENLIDRRTNVSRALYDYSAQELTCSTGELLESSASQSGWVWCHNKKGAQGWIPLRALQKIVSD